MTRQSELFNYEERGVGKPNLEGKEKIRAEGKKIFVRRR